MIWLTIGNFSRIGANAIFYLSLAKILAVEEFGVYAAIAAGASVFFPLVGLGSGLVLIEKTATRRENLLKLYIGSAGIIGVTSIVFGAIYLYLAELFLGVLNAKLILMMIVSEFLFMRLIELNFQVCQSQKESKRAGCVLMLYGFVKVFSLVACYFYFDEGGKLESYIYTSAIGNSLVFLISILFIVNNFLGLAVGLDFKFGVSYAFGLVSQSIYNDADKIILSKMESSSDVANYGFAYKLVDMATVPIKSMLASIYAEFFVQGKDGVRSALVLAKRQLKKLFLLNLFCLSSLFIAMQFVPVFFSDKYLLALAIAPYLSLLLIFRTVHYIIGDVLTGSGLQRYRAAAQAAVALLSIGVCFYFIGIYGVWGAVLSSLVSDLCLIVLLGFVLIYYAKFSKKIT